MLHVYTIILSSCSEVKWESISERFLNNKSQWLQRIPPRVSMELSSIEAIGLSISGVITSLKCSVKCSVASCLLGRTMAHMGHGCKISQWSSMWRSHMSMLFITWEHLMQSYGGSSLPFLLWIILWICKSFLDLNLQWIDDIKFCVMKHIIY